MALVTRLSRLFRADFHAVLDRIEEPDLQLRQAVREMQFALDQDRQRLQLLQHEVTRLDKAGTDATTILKSFDEELDLCLAANEDDLARDVIRRKLAGDKQLRVLQQQSASIESQRQALDRQIDEQNQQLTAMNQKLELLVSDDCIVGSQFNQADTIRNEEIEIALLQEKKRRVNS